MLNSQNQKELKGKKVKRESREIFPQEVLLDSLAQRKRFFGKKRFEVPLRSSVFFGFSLAFVIIFSVLVGKSFWLGIVKGEQLSDLAVSNHQRIYYTPTDRGVIYDKNMKQLVFNSTSFDLGCYKKDLPLDQEKRKDLFRRVSGTTGVQMKEMEEKVEKSEKERVLLVQNLEHEKVISLRAQIEELPGFYLKENIIRNYVSGPSFSHVIGYLGRTEDEKGYSSLDYIGKMGLEKSYEKVLRGEKGKFIVKKDVFSEEVSRRKVGEAEPGQSLVLWIDEDLQKKAESSLKASLDRVGAESGAVVAMDPDTGGVLSLVSIPTFDNNIFFQNLDAEEWEKVFGAEEHPFWNRTLSGAYPSGSTIKPLIAIGGLEEGIISPRRSILCEGEIKVENPWFPDQPFYFHDWTVHGWTDMRKAIAESCNVFFYTLGGGYGGIDGLGVERIKKYLNLFGWGEMTGVDLPGERKGLIPDPEWKKAHFEEKGSQIWLPGDTYNLSIGQGYLSATPLQVTSSFVAVANGGTLFKPRVVKEIVDQNKNRIREVEPEVKREGFVDPESIEVAREGMRQAVISGSSTLLQGMPVRSGSKTGTAQTGKEDVYHNWVTVFAPYDDPEIVLTVMIENVSDEQVAALPVAREVLNWYFGGGSD